MDVRELRKAAHAALGRRTRCDKIYADAAEKQAAYRERKREREIERRWAALNRAVESAAAMGNRTAILLRQQETEDLAEALTGALETWQAERAARLERQALSERIDATLDRRLKERGIGSTPAAS